ncbi:hypothetical protein KBY58_07170 [Cyanobium sp. HWJ4-Hawea]|uniref:hypothetical protein n=1 Tax=Cyanobium sp. HWJ4-Hawea TaxID=2823713 RepID=UPI0020CEF73E|nr:hypothetical protein [Cyanobium sp. HWJ4-Hawea]MCP9809212.1 hypothetical protein [Cyanobium sp. HWJ4-Hawea]
MSSISCPSQIKSLLQGACVTVDADDQLYQVIGVDDSHNRCWLRRWPLTRSGSEVFEISLQRVQPERPHRP